MDVVLVLMSVVVEKRFPSDRSGRPGGKKPRPESINIIHSELQLTKKKKKNLPICNISLS